MAYNINDDFQPWVTLAETTGACEEGVTFARALGDIDMQTGLSAFTDLSHITWIFLQMGDTLSTPLRNILISKFQSAPRLAATIYISADITAQEAAQLHNVFRGLLPTIEHELDTGIVVPYYQENN